MFNWLTPAISLDESLAKFGGGGSELGKRRHDTQT